MRRAENGDLIEPGTYTAYVWTDSRTPERIPGAVAEGTMDYVRAAASNWIANASKLGADVWTRVTGAEWYAAGIGFLIIRPAGSAEGPSVRQGCAKCHGGDMICEETGSRARCRYCGGWLVLP